MAETGKDRPEKATERKGVWGIALTLVGLVGFWGLPATPLASSRVVGVVLLALTPAGIVMGALMLRDIRGGAPGRRRFALITIRVGVIATTVSVIGLLALYVAIHTLLGTCGGGC